MFPEMQTLRGKVLTVRGPVEPAVLGKVMMHEHLHCDIYDWEAQQLLIEEKPITEERRALLMREAVPCLQQCNAHGCHAFVDPTAMPWRAWPTFYVEASEAAQVHIILVTGFYREVEIGTYWVKKPEDRMWPFVLTASVEELADLCTREIVQGIHGTGVRAGAIKLGSSLVELSALEQKTFAAGARAQQATGVHITTHCTKWGAETSQLKALARGGADLRRCVIGHTAGHLMDPATRKRCLAWMREGANFLPTNMGITHDSGDMWRPLVEAIHEVFQAGQGDKLCFGLDWAFVSESGPFGACTFIPPPPFLHMFTHTLPAFRKMGLTPEEEDWIMRKNPQRIVAIA